VGELGLSVGDHNGEGYHSKGRHRDARSFRYSTTVHGIQFNLTFSTRSCREVELSRVKVDSI